MSSAYAGAGVAMRVSAAVMRAHTRAPARRRMKAMESRLRVRIGTVNTAPSFQHTLSRSVTADVALWTGLWIGLWEKADVRGTALLSSLDQPAPQSGANQV